MKKSRNGSCCALLVLLAAAPIAVQGQEQEKPPVALEQEQEKPPTEPARPPEGTTIINLPSAEVNAPKVLQLFITHRFADRVSGSGIHHLFSFDSGADIDLGLSYVPVKNLEVGFRRSKRFEDYELSAKYQFISSEESPFGLALRLGGDARTLSTPDACSSGNASAIFCSFFDDRYSFYAQAVAALSLFSRVRFTVVPTYVSRSAQQFNNDSASIHKKILNIPAAIAIAVTRSFNVQAEVVPGLSRAASGGVGWILALEKTVLRHRFSFTVGNLRWSTVDQYVGADFKGVDFRGPLNPLSARDYFLGFNIVRQWKL